MDKKSKGRWDAVEVLLTKNDILNYYHECDEEAKSLDYVIQENKNLQGIDDDSMLDILPMVQGIEVNPILINLKISKDFSILQRPFILISHMQPLNDDTAHKKV